MPILIHHALSDKAGAAAYEAWLKGILPPEDTAVISEGAFLFLALAGVLSSLSSRCMPSEEMAPFPLKREDAAADHEKSALAAWQDWRRLPAGSAMAATAEGLFLFTREHMPLAREDCRPFTVKGLLNEVITDKEAAARYGMPEKTVKAALTAGTLSPDEAVKEGTVWLIRQSAAERTWGGKPEKDAINPLLLVYPTAYAALLWGLDSGDVRAAAAGAGHRAARMDDQDRRRAGRTWLVTRSAMERLYGSPDPQEWRKHLAALYPHRP